MVSPSDVVVVLAFLMLTSLIYYGLYEIEQTAEMFKIAFAKEIILFAVVITFQSYFYMFEYFRNRKNAEEVKANFDMLLKLQARFEEHIANMEAKFAQQQEQQQPSEGQPIGGVHQYFEQEEIFELQIENNIV